MKTAELLITAPEDEPTIITERFVKASPEFLYEMWTTPEHMRRWLGPRYLEMPVCEVDLRVGGQYHYVHKAPDGSEYSFRGEYLELDRPHRIVATFIFEEYPSSIDTVTFEPVDGGTLVHGHTLHQTMESRDAAMASGMEGGMRESYERLDELASARN
ncbi:MAG: SRPBCC family protein [bacterium]|nr:SRPBCC family protein [bacterium]